RTIRSARPHGRRRETWRSGSQRRTRPVPARPSHSGSIWNGSICSTARAGASACRSGTRCQSPGRPDRGAASGGGLEEGHMRYVGVVIGLVAVLIGIVWTLQGLNVLGGSAMSGDSTWAIVGPIVAVVGMLVVLFALRRRDT